MMEEMSNGTEHAKENKFEPNKKYSSDDEEKLIKWISSLTGSAPADSGQQGFCDWLKDGQVLARLMNTIKPNSYTPNPPSNSRIEARRTMMEKENVNLFIEAAKAYGVPSRDLFQMPYLYEQENMYQVQLALVLLQSLYEKKTRQR